MCLLSTKRNEVQKEVESKIPPLKSTLFCKDRTRTCLDDHHSLSSDP